MEDMKQCKKCNELKPRTTEYFYRQNSRKPDGLHPWCKECAKSHRKANRARENARNNERWATDEGYREQRLRIQRNWTNKNREHKRESERENRLKNPEPYKRRVRDYAERHKEELKIQKRATYEVTKTIKSGLLERPTVCEWCSNEHPNIEAAHHDYDKPLDIQWLCKPCHARWDYHEPKLIKPKKHNSKDAS